EEVGGEAPVIVAATKPRVKDQAGRSRRLQRFLLGLGQISDELHVLRTGPIAHLPVKDRGPDACNCGQSFKELVRDLPIPTRDRRIYGEFVPADVHDQCSSRPVIDRPALGGNRLYRLYLSFTLFPKLLTLADVDANNLKGY